jgi:excinuclease UvrABC nuclease subunit
MDATAPTQPGVYAFIVDDIVMYIGVTNDSLRTCLHQYRRGHEGQRTRARVKKPSLRPYRTEKGLKF